MAIGRTSHVTVVSGVRVNNLQAADMVLLAPVRRVNFEERRVGFSLLKRAKSGALA